MQDETEGSRTLSETTTKFIGNIIFNDGEKDILVSDLASVEEVNEALSVCITNDKVDTYTKMWMSTEPTQPFYLNPDFDYKDDHVMSSKAVKELIHLSSDTSSPESIDLSEYRKIDDLTVIDPNQLLPIDSIDSFTDYSLANFENITTASVEYSDELYNQGVTFIGTFVLVEDESIKYDFVITHKNPVTMGATIKITPHPIDVDPPANNFVWAKTNGGLWLTNGKGSYKPTYRVILKSAIVGTIDKLVVKSELDEYIQELTQRIENIESQITS